MNSFNHGTSSFQYDPDKEFINDLTIAGTDINWASGVYKELTLTANTVLTFSNLRKGKTIMIRITGSFTLALPSYCELVNGGTYDGTKFNYLVLYCASTVTPRVCLAINKTA